MRRPALAATGGSGSWADPPGQFGLAFLLDGDDPAGDLGVQNHAFMVRLRPSIRQ
jgi:hypothetical protein